MSTLFVHKQTMLTRFLFLIIVPLTLSKAQIPSVEKKVQKSPTEKKVEMPAYMEYLKSEADFLALGSDPLTNKYNDVVSVKVVYDLHLKKIFYINSANFDFHYEFCQKYLDPTIYLSKFNEENYGESSVNRKYLLGNINYFGRLKTFALELSPSDQMQIGSIEQLITEIRVNSFLGPELKLMLSTQRLIDLRSEFKGLVKFLTPEDIYENMETQSVSEGLAIGRLRFVENFDVESTTFSSTDILVIKETPLILPRVAGVIVAEFQTPLSHLSILGKNRKMPVLAMKNAFGNSSLLAFRDMNVQLEVKCGTYEIEKSDKSPNVSFSPKNKIELEFDLKVDTLIGVDHLNRKSENFAGNKARNFGWLYDISKNGNFRTPENAFAIPFHFYFEHIQKSKAKDLIAQLCKNPSDYQNPAKLEAHLSEIRKAILAEPINPHFLKLVENRVKESPKYLRMRFRSSTNAEDADGFSGAGLYASKTGEIGNADKSVEKAIKTVWASLWSYPAYVEREYFNIDQSTVQMGVLAHRSFPEEEVNGVIITKNLYRKHYPGFVVNTQVGNESVVKPSSGVVCEQFICYAQTGRTIQPYETVIDIITYSSLNKSKPLMKEKEVQLLANEVDKIKLEVYRKLGRSHLYEDFGLDLEFKLDAVTRQLYIKQMRRYND